MAGPPGDDIAPLLAGAVLLAGFALLAQRRSTGLIRWLAAQGCVVAAAAAWQVWVQGAPALAVAAVAVLAATGVAVPLALRDAIRRSGLPGAVAMTIGVFPGLALAAAVTVLVALLVQPVPMPPSGREALALSVVLLGLLLTVTRRAALVRAAGLAAAGNGLVLEVVQAPGLPLVAALAVAVPAAALALVAGVTLGPRGDRPAGAPP